MECKYCGESNLNEFYKTNTMCCKTCVKNRFKNWTKVNLLKYRFVSARNRAKYKNIEFTISLDDLSDLIISQDNKCFYSGIEFNPDDEHYTPSIERVDSSRGYVKDNIRLIVNCINYMKNDMSEEKFFEVINIIYNYRNS